MSLSQTTIDQVMTYCKRDLPANQKWFEEEFNFIKSASLRKELAKEFYAARYIYKLMEALHVSGVELHAHAKFQITQYASIYEACINYILREVYKTHAEVIKISTHRSLKGVSALSKHTKISYEGTPALICLEKPTKTEWTAIPFENKVDAAVAIGVISSSYAEEIKRFYQLRNGIHIESAAKRQITYELEQAKLAYRRMSPFIAEIKAHFANSASTP